jgi:transposase
MDILNLDSYTVIDLQEQSDHYQLTVSLDAIADACPYCKSEAIQRFGSKRQVFQDLPIHGKRTGIVIDRQRYRCKECGRTFSEVLPHMDEKRAMTARLLAYMQNASIERPFTHVATEVGVSEKTVRNVFQEHIALTTSRNRSTTSGTKRRLRSKPMPCTAISTSIV